MSAVLYAVPGSHPCAVAAKALELKGVAYRRVEMIPVLHRVPQRLRFGAGSVPALTFGDGTTVTGSRAIVRALEERVAQPALLPADEDRRARVERAEQWGEQVLQPLARRVTWAALARAPKAMPTYTGEAKLMLPRPLTRAGGPLVALVARRLTGASDATVRADLISLPRHADRIDGWIEDGTLGGDAVNAADLQIGAGMRLLLTLADVRELLDGRPAAAHARRWFPVFPGDVAAGALPAAWVDAAR
jgi:glutathione S-transferase